MNKQATHTAKLATKQRRQTNEYKTTIHQGRHHIPTETYQKCKNTNKTSTSNHQGIRIENTQ